MGYIVTRLDKLGQLVWIATSEYLLAMTGEEGNGDTVSSRT